MKYSAKVILTLGEFLAPFMPYQIPPPTAPIEKAPPKSFRMTHGLQLLSGLGYVPNGLQTKDLLYDQYQTLNSIYGNKKGADLGKEPVQAGSEQQKFCIARAPAAFIDHT